LLGKRLVPGRKAMEKGMKPFEFKECVIVPKSTGKKARNLRELRSLVGRVSDESIVHHTYQYFLSGHTLEYTNAFAHWAGESLGEKGLSEHLSNIDPYAFSEIKSLRNELLKAVDGRLETPPRPRDAAPGDEFFFSESITLIFPIRLRARNLAEFLMAVRYVDGSSIYYHFYEARTRLEGGADDFSKWISGFLGQEDLGEKIRSIDPFMHTLEGIREHIVEAVEDEVRKQMEELS
jgi:hypothetical protein